MFVRPGPGFSKPRVDRAVGRAIEFARRAGLETERGEVIAEGANVLVRLEPVAALARISHWVDILRVDGAMPWYRREIELTSWLAERGVQVPRPIAGPFDDDGVSISFWEWLEHEPRPEMPDTALGASLAELHEVLAGYDGELPDIRAVVAEVDPLCEFVPDRRVGERVRAKLDWVTRELDRHDHGRRQALHGDAHWGNLVLAGGRPSWLDFEDTCRGPVEYDLACLVATARMLSDRDEAAVVAGYGGEVDRALLDVMIEARLMQTAMWCALLLTEAPEMSVFRERLDWWLENF